MSREKPQAPLVAEDVTGAAAAAAYKEAAAAAIVPPKAGDAGIALPTVAAVDLPFETKELREGLARFLDSDYLLEDGKKIRLGAVQWGVYAFFDYDDKPIYVGQTNATLGDRIGRHLTNQRTDVVAMNVLDPFEVHSICVWPLPQFQALKKNSPKEQKATAQKKLNALEYQVFEELKEEEFSFLNEKDPQRPADADRTQMPEPIRGQVVSDEVKRLRDHPDLRIARRASTLAKLAQKISERSVKPGLRRALVSQASRLLSLAQQRYEAVQRLKGVGVVVGGPVEDASEHDGDEEDDQK